MNTIDKYFKNHTSNSPISQKYLNPAKILYSSDSNSKNIVGLIENNCVQTSVAEDSDIFTLKGEILIDFGVELYGSIEIITGDTTNEKEIRVAVQFGESAGEAMQASDYRHVVQNFEMKLPNYGKVESSLCGFRFVNIKILDENQAVEIKSIKAVLHFRDIAYKGSFYCSDPLLNQIWETGAYTVHLNMQNYIWDGIKRDRLVWAGDVHPAIMVINSVFGNNPIVNDTFEYLRDSTPLPGFMNNFCSYSIWWLISLRDWYSFHEDFGKLLENKTYIINLLDYLEEHISQDGVEKLKNNRFLDWNTLRDKDAIHAGLQALMVMAFQAGAELLEKINCNDKAESARKKAKLLQKYVPQTNNKQAVALQVLAGQLDSQYANSKYLSINPLKNLSTFYGYYILQARAKAGDMSGCIDLIQKYWGAMLELGATTFWESFDIAWLRDAAKIDEINSNKIDVHKTYGEHCYKSYRHSLCHAWAAGPTAWLSEHLLGVNKKSRCLSYQITQPPLLDLNLNFVKGTFPVISGELKIEHKIINGKIDTSIEAPSGINIEVLTNSYDCTYDICN